MSDFDEAPTTPSTKCDPKNNSIFFDVCREGETRKYTIIIERKFYDGQSIPLDESAASVERVRKHLLSLLSDTANCSIRDSRIEHMFDDFDDFDDEPPLLDNKSEDEAAYLKYAEMKAYEDPDIKQFTLFDYDSAEIMQFNLGGTLWFICLNADGKRRICPIDSNIRKLAVTGEMPAFDSLDMEGQNPYIIQSLLQTYPIYSIAVFSPSMAPLCVVYHRDVPEKNFRSVFKPKHVTDAEDRRTAKLKQLAEARNRLNSYKKLDVNGNRWFIYLEDGKIFEVTYNELNQSMLRMSMKGLIFSFAVFSKDLKLVHEACNPALAHLNYNFTDLVRNPALVHLHCSFTDLVSAVAVAAVSHEMLFSEGIGGVFDGGILDAVF